MSERSLAAGAPTPERRERVVAELCEHFAAGHLELDALEQRLAAADRAGNVRELDGLVADLPVLAIAPPAVAEPPRRRGWALALLGGNSRKGEWSPPRQLNAVAIMGGVELDFRDARLAAGETHVTALALMGGIDIIVPPGLPVTVRGMGVLGGVDQVEHAAQGASPDAPRLTVTAVALMGGVAIQTRPSKRTEQIVSKRME